MSAIEAYLAELRSALRVKGRARRRILAECAGHLREAASGHGEAEAVARFGPVDKLAASFDAELAAHRGQRATVGMTLALAAAAATVLDFAHSGRPDPAAPHAFAIVFGIAGQVAAVALVIAVVQALRWRGTMPPAGALVVLARRNRVAVTAAALTIAAAAGTVTGRSLAPLGAFGALGIALWCARRGSRLARALPAARGSHVESPLEDLAVLAAGAPVVGGGVEWVRNLLDPVRHPVRTCAVVAVFAAAGAFARDQWEGAATGPAALTAGIEAAAVIGAFVALGPTLGLRTRRRA